MSNKSLRFVPRLEALDGRWLPAVTYELVGSTLLVHGDAGDNTITITDDGTLTGVSIEGDGVPVFPVDPQFPARISAIVVDAGVGHDVVVYNLTGTLSVARLVGVDLGRGADAFTINLNGNTVTGAETSLGFTSAGDGGKDTLTLNAQSAHVDTAAALDVTFEGQAGKDTIVFNFDPGFDLLPNVTLTKDQKH